MSYRTILVDLSAERPVGPRLEAARTLAARFQTALVGMHAMPQPFVPTFWEGGASVYLDPALTEAQRNANREIKERVRMVFQDFGGADPSLVWVWREAEGEPGRLLAAAAHAADLVLAERGEAGADGYGMIEQLVAAAGVPVLMLPPNAVGDLGRTVLVGWNGTREATRAAHGALPFLVDAKRVVLCAVGEAAAASLEDAAMMLRRHGVAVEPQPVAGSDAAAGEILLAQAGAHGADLLVMGAYGHARVRELIFGGATRHVLCQATLPVLFGS